jgi:predicted PurR-regulated permease PerM
MQTNTTKILTALGAVLAAIAIAFLAAVIMAYPVKWLWNWLVPSIFGLRTVSALEAWGLTLLIQLLLPKTKTKTEREG